jgi:hypothetical protein
MNDNRLVQRMLSVFDLKDYKDFNLPEGVSTRALFLYDEKVKEFRMIDRSIPAEVNQEINSWLKENLEICHFMQTVNGEPRDADL